MTPEKRARLQAAGHLVVDDPAEWLDRDDIELQVVGLSQAIAREVKRLRTEAGLTQAALAERIGSTRPRVSKIESTSSEIGLDLMFRAFFALGGRIENLASRPTGA